MGQPFLAGVLAVPTVHMPKLSDSMAEGTIVRWLKHDGEPVRGGEELVEIETDKATMVYEAEHSGRLQIIAGDGATLAVGAPIGRISDGAGPSGATVRPGAAAGAAPGAPAGARTARAKVSPLARRLAAELGVDLAAVNGSGPAGRVVKRDVHAAAATATAPAAPSGPAQQAGPDALKGTIERIAPSASQVTIARRMVLAKSTIPEFTLDTEIRMDAALALREAARGLERERLPSVTDLIVKACALALREHPAVNGAFLDGTVERYGRVNIGLAVAAPGTLLVPTIFDADAKSLGQIARESRLLAQRSRDGLLAPPELAGGTFTVSNLGMYGITSFTAVLNPPQAAILAAGAVLERLALRDGEPVAQRCMTVTLTCDHRVVYGADGAAFLRSVRENLEEPLRLAL